MRGTRTPLRVVWAAYLVATHHPGISAKQLQRQLGLCSQMAGYDIVRELGTVKSQEFGMDKARKALKRHAKRKGANAVLDLSVQTRTKSAPADCSQTRTASRPDTTCGNGGHT